MKHTLVEEFSDWVKIPNKMQHQFFEHAKEEAQHIKVKLLEDKAKLLQIKKMLSFNNVGDDSSWRDWRIAVVDGSDSPIMSDRIGARFGTYGATYHIFQGLDLVDEDYYCGHFVDPQIGYPEASKKLLSLLTTSLERDVALACLRKDIDLLIIDGSFFGFRPQCRIVHNRLLFHHNFDNGKQLVEHVRDTSRALLKSGKAIGIIKRIQTAAIDGWLIYKTKDKSLMMRRNDRDIFSSLMRERQWISYESIFEDPTLFNYFTRLAQGYDRYALLKNIVSIFQACKNDVKRNIKRDLLCNSSEIFITSRHFIRTCYPAAPFSFETPIDFDLNPVISFFQSAHNKVTGLPILLDLTDQDITIPTGFTQEFVEEIEAHLIKDKDLDKYELENHFASLNPQKQE